MVNNKDLSHTHTHKNAILFQTTLAKTRNQVSNKLIEKIVIDNNKSFLFHIFKRYILLLNKELLAVAFLFENFLLLYVIIIIITYYNLLNSNYYFYLKI